MKVQNMTNSGGNSVPNQFHIVSTGPIVWDSGLKTGSGSIFQSYGSTIVFKEYTGKIYLDENKWDYSTTTGRYRNQFLQENKAATQKKIDSGEYTLANLN